MAKNTPEKRELRRQRAAEVLKESQRAERRRKVQLIALIVGVFVLIAAAVFAIDRFSGPSADQQQTPTVATAADGTQVELDGFGILVGDPAAPTTVTIYEDLQCPACANLEAQVGEKLSAAVEAGDVRVDYRMISFLDRASTNEYSSRAFNAVLAVLKTAGGEAFRAFHDDLYANQPEEGGAGFDDDELVDRAVDAGASEDEVRPLIEGKVFAQWIEDATDQSSRDGVNGTPSVRINGEESDGQALAALLEMGAQDTQ